MFGAMKDDLPAIWEELNDAGFESGQAYGKSLRTVKSYVGTTCVCFIYHQMCPISSDRNMVTVGCRYRLGGMCRECARGAIKSFWRDRY